MKYLTRILLLLSCSCSSSEPAIIEKTNEPYTATLTPEKSSVLKEQQINMLKIIEIDPQSIKGLTMNKNEKVKNRFFAVRVEKGGNTPSKRLLWFDITLFFGKLKREEKVSVHLINGEKAFRVFSINWPFTKKIPPTAITVSGFTYK